MITGARKARQSWFRRLVSGAVARELSAFVVPGPEVARAYGLDIEAAGLRVAATPRHASALLLVGELPEGLRDEAAITYAQMARPRAIFAVGAGDDVSPLPEPDVSVNPGQDALEAGVVELRRSFAEGAFSPEATAFEADELEAEEDGEGEGMHHHGGMDHQDHHEADSGGSEEAHADHEMQHGDSGMNHEGMDHGHMDHGDMGFMSMVEMTKDLPRSEDGLPMEWVETPFGPFFPGLPGGLNLTLTLDGDTVAQAEATPGMEGRATGDALSGPVEGFATRLGRLDPLAPVAYRLLALRAIEDAAGAAVGESAALARAGTLERERAASHLNWLASFGYLLGDDWLARRAGQLQLALLRAEDTGEVARVGDAVKKLAGRVRRTPLLERRLAGIGRLGRAEAAKASGPVARAAGVAYDARDDEEPYRELGFAAVIVEGNDALSRLRVRLAEVERSLELVRAAGSLTAEDRPVSAASSGKGTAIVETPRGAARLSVTLQGGVVSAAKLDAPSVRHLDLVKPVAEQRELADALVGVASLDLSPWEAAR